VWRFEASPISAILKLARSSTLASSLPAVLGLALQAWRVPLSRPTVPIRAVSMLPVLRQTLRIFQIFLYPQRPLQLARRRSYRQILLAHVRPWLAHLGPSNPKPP